MIIKLKIIDSGNSKNLSLVNEIGEEPSLLLPESTVHTIYIKIVQPESKEQKEEFKPFSWGSLE